LDESAVQPLIKREVILIIFLGVVRLPLKDFVEVRLDSPLVARVALTVGYQSVEEVTHFISLVSFGYFGCLA
jgi:hypothetical protein